MNIAILVNKLNEVKFFYNLKKIYKHNKLFFFYSKKFPDKDAKSYLNIREENFKKFEIKNVIISYKDHKDLEKLLIQSKINRIVSTLEPAYHNTNIHKKIPWDIFVINWDNWGDARCMKTLSECKNIFINTSYEKKKNISLS